MKRFAAVVCAFAASLGWAHHASAQSNVPDNFPSKPIVIVVPYPPGGAVDVMARAMAEGLGSKLGKPVVVENRAGGGGTVAAAYVANAAPDGYTLLCSDLAPLVIARSAMPKLSYDTLKDFVGISLGTNATLNLSIRKDLPASSVAEFVKLAKEAPGGITYSSAGVASITHVAGALFESLTKTQLRHIPYRGGAPATVAVLSGEVDASFTQLITSLPYLKEGKMRSLGVTLSERSRLAPDLPTLDEQGVKGYQLGVWQGVVAPAATPKPVVEFLSNAFREVLLSPTVNARLTGLGYDVTPMGSSEFTAFMGAEAKRWEKVVHAADIRVE